MRDGKEILTEAQLKAERTKMLNKRHETRIKEQVAKNKETSDKQIRNTEKIVELVKRSKENLEENLEFKEGEAKSHKRDQVIVIVLMALYIGYILYTYLASGEIKDTPDYDESLWNLEI